MAYKAQSRSSLSPLFPKVFLFHISLAEGRPPHTKFFQPVKKHQSASPLISPLLSDRSGYQRRDFAAYTRESRARPQWVVIRGPDSVEAGHLRSAFLRQSTTLARLL